MQTRTKLVLMELIGGTFGWVWLGASAFIVYALVVAVFFDGAWSPVLWAFGIGVTAKWLAAGFTDSGKRVAYEAMLVARGMSPDEAGKAWLQAYSGGANKLSELQATEHTERAEALPVRIEASIRYAEHPCTQHHGDHEELTELQAAAASANDELDRVKDVPSKPSGYNEDDNKA